MSAEEAWLYAASWGSYMTSGDPGACMYGFDEQCRPQSEEHRAAVLEYIQACRRHVELEPGDYDEDELEKMDKFVAFIAKRNLPGQPDDPFIIEISLCGYVGACQANGEELEGQPLIDLQRCARGDGELACQYVLDTYRPEFRIVRKTGNDYENVTASLDEKTKVCHDIYFESDTDFTQEANANLYLVWSAAGDLEDK